MSKQPPPGQEQTQYKTKERPAERPPATKTNPQVDYVPEPATTTLEDTQTTGKQKPAVSMGEKKVTAGRAGERNIAIQWISTPVGNHMSARFNVTTAAGNPLEVTIGQLEYRRVFTGEGTVATAVVPVAPIGTAGKLIARDVATGEIAEQPWKWYLIGGGGWSLWGLIKRLFGF